MSAGQGTWRVTAAGSVSAEEDFDLCNECGGLCCALYLAHDEDGAYIGDGWLPEYIQLWLERLCASGALVVTATEYHAGPAGVEPLHDPRISHLPTPEGDAYRASLPAWIDVRKCQFCHPDTGCLLPRAYRADICREWTCELWRGSALSFRPGTCYSTPAGRWGPKDCDVTHRTSKRQSRRFVLPRRGARKKVWNG